MVLPEYVCMCERVHASVFRIVTVATLIIAQVTYSCHPILQP